MSNLSKLPRDLIARIASDPRSIRFIENLQSQAFDLLPSQIQEIITRIQEARLAAEQAQGYALQALNKPDTAILPLLPAGSSPDQQLGLITPIASAESSLALLSMPQPCAEQLIPIPIHTE